MRFLCNPAKARKRLLPTPIATSGCAKCVCYSFVQMNIFDFSFLALALVSKNAPVFRALFLYFRISKLLCYLNSPILASFPCFMSRYFMTLFTSFFSTLTSKPRLPPFISWIMYNSDSPSSSILLGSLLPPTHAPTLQTPQSPTHIYYTYFLDAPERRCICATLHPIVYYNKYSFILVPTTFVFVPSIMYLVCQSTLWF